MRKLTVLAVMLAMMLMMAAPAYAETFTISAGASSVMVDDGFFSNEVTVQAGNTSFTVDDDFFGGAVFGDEGITFGDTFPF